MSGWPPPEDDPLVGTGIEDDSLAPLFTSSERSRTRRAAPQLELGVLFVAVGVAVAATVVQWAVFRTFSVYPMLVVAVFAAFTSAVVFGSAGLTAFVRVLSAQTAIFGMFFGAPLLSYFGLSCVYIVAVLTGEPPFSVRGGGRR